MGRENIGRRSAGGRRFGRGRNQNPKVWGSKKLYDYVEFERELPYFSKFVRMIEWAATIADGV